MKNTRKRLNCYVDADKYERLKRILDIMGITVTDYINESMDNFINGMEQAVLNQDKDAFLQLMTKNLDVIQKQVEEEIKKK